MLKRNDAMFVHLLTTGLISLGVYFPYFGGMSAAAKNMGVIKKILINVWVLLPWAVWSAVLHLTGLVPPPIPIILVGIFMIVPVWTIGFRKGKREI